MTTNQPFFTRPRLWGLLCGLTLAVAQLFTPAGIALAALVWQIQIVDSAGDVGQYTALTLDSSGNPVISYFDFTNRDLKLVHCGNATCSSGNTIQTVEGVTAVGLYTALVLDSSGNPVISYYDFTNFDLKLVHCGNAACTSGNTLQTVDSAGNVGQFTALALDSSGNPVISYYDFTNFDLKLAHCGNAACSSGNTIQTVDSAGAVGRFTALALDSSGNPVISYYATTNSDLKLVHCGNAACTSGNTIQTVDSAGNVGQYTALALDSSGNPVISYYDFTNFDLKLAHCGDAACTSGNTIQTVDSGGDVGQYNTLALDSSGNPIISYYDFTNFDLKLVHCGNAACTSGNTIQTVESAGDVGQFTALALDSSDNPVISYLDFTTFDLKLARLVDDSTPPSVTLNQAAGQADPTTSNPMLFTARFSEPVTGFTPADVTLSGTANLAGASVTVSGGPTEYTISVAGVGGNGTVMATLAANVVTDAAGNGNTASTSGDNSVTFLSDSTPPLITPSVVGPVGNNGWYVNDVTVSWSVVDNESAISSQSDCETQNVTSDTSGLTFTCSATSTGGTASQSVTIQRDATAPTISTAATTPPNANGWYNSNVTVHFTCADNLSGVVSCPADQVLSSEGSAVSSTAPTISDGAGNQSAASNVVTVQIDRTAPVVTLTGVSNGAAYTVGSVPAAGCSTTDALSGVATQATVNITGGNPDGTGTFTATCSGATDQADNSAAPVSVSYTVNAPVDACTTAALRDNFNRANGGLGSNWAGATNQSFYKVTNNQVDVQLGGPVVWKPTTFGVNQAAFVTLSTLDAAGPSQGLLLKVQGSSIPTAGAIAVVYDNLAKAVRVSTLRLNTPAWMVYGNTPATFANGDKLIGCVQANGTVRVYRNNSLLTTVTLNAADQSFFNAKGGKIGLWTVAASNAFVDDFGGGVLTGVTGAAALDINAVPDEAADDGTELTVAIDLPTDEVPVSDPAVANPDPSALVNRIFLPLVNR